MNFRLKSFVLLILIVFTASFYLANIVSQNQPKSYQLLVNTPEHISTAANQCSLSTCFNFTRCYQNGFKIYIYKPFKMESKIYTQMIDSIKSTRAVTNDPEQACLFVPAVDTLDRDRLSPNFVKNLAINELEYWNGGENHLIFNLYSGSWPNYVENLEMNTSKAILVKASCSINSYRSGFDVSFPLFHSDLPFNSSNSTLTKPNLTKKYFLSFKGKRYLTGVGSETRNALYHLHNGRDIILLTTCKHGYNWEELKDDRCDTDNSKYGKYDYIDLLNHSLFCLVPRGRRLATYRFLEALKSGCVPVLLSNGWVLPFDDVLDWSQAVVWADEDRLTEIVPRLRSIPKDQVARMSQLGFQIYVEYFSSIERIMTTTLGILESRIFKTKFPVSVVSLNPAPVLLDYSPKCQLIFVCVQFSNNLFKLENIHKRLSFIERILLIDCWGRKLSQEMNLRFEYFSNDGDIKALNESMGSECVVFLKEDWLPDEIALKRTYRLWVDNKDSLVGSSGLSVKLRGGCIRPGSDIEDGYNSLGFEFIFVRISHVRLLMRMFDIWSSCSKTVWTLSDSLFKCMAPTMSMIISKAKVNKPFILVKFVDSYRAIGFDYSAFCYDEIFRKVFTVNSTLFSNFIPKQFRYFD